MSFRGKAFAILEVSLYRFVALAIVQIGLLKIPGLIDWQRNTTGYSFTTGAVFILMTLLLLWITKRDLKNYGLNFTPLRYHLNIAGISFIPFVLAGIPLGFGVDYRRWDGSLIMAGTQIALLMAVALLLRRKASLFTLIGVSIFLIPGMRLAGPEIGKALASFLYFLVFVGFGEEILYRGYIETRLNEAFARPYRFIDVRWGWGTILSAFIFGLSHVGLVSFWIGETASLTWAWGFWTFFGGLVFSYIRQKTGSILAPAILHGGPQAVLTGVTALGFAV
jgi:membrane protease YdiL (CAAX protease family)